MVVALGPSALHMDYCVLRETLELSHPGLRGEIIFASTQTQDSNKFQDSGL
jgi:hypothetical protein